MKKEEQELKYSDDDTLKKAIRLIKNGRKEKEVQVKFNLSGADMDLIDFVINEY
ncbi:hypothetical protein GCM10007216_19860 [Thalassobacillus devorans]|uniref:Uncharacterized protein n=1 Tax=Thalassobacillus devorans TaxID=279813 RepID=A0ABQ1P1E2_9BACI|nr:hypothetical protein [Thalassobacillus devorans]NIK28070.1 hypothetical protein [Thalassobacillus devorans]GGC89111.1 hypothetical protein GCM10007216_19860 [Thalassobacillus devorans]